MPDLSPLPPAEAVPRDMSTTRLAYQRARFNTRLPTDRVFTESHFWLALESEDVHRVGFTRFATRMLGEVVEYDFEVSSGAPVARGQAIGWVEGFKAVSELYAPVDGTFVGENPDLDAQIGSVHKQPYDAGWLYRIRGPVPGDALDAEGYAAFLDATIDRMMGRES